MAKKILLVDDDRDLVFIVREALLKQGYEVLSAPEGAQALRIIKEQQVDLMIVDLTMPGMNGWKFTMKARQEPNYKSTPIIVISGLLDRDSTAESFEGATLYLVKPFDIIKLLARIKAFLA